jgi:hypothetical protein
MTIGRPRMRRARGARVRFYCFLLLRRACILSREPLPACVLGRFNSYHTQERTYDGVAIDLAGLRSFSRDGRLRRARRGYQRARTARGARWTTIRFLKLYGDFSSMFMVKNGSETPRHGEPWELGDG